MWCGPSVWGGGGPSVWCGPSVWAGCVGIVIAGSLNPTTSY